MTTRGEAAALPFLRARRAGEPLTLGRFLQAIRLGEEQTLDSFATQLGISKQHLSDIEHDRRGVSLERAAAWAKALGYHAGQFVQLAVQAQLQAAQLPFHVIVNRATSPLHVHRTLAGQYITRERVAYRAKAKAAPRARSVAKKAAARKRK